MRSVRGGPLGFLPTDRFQSGCRTFHYLSTSNNSFAQFLGKDKAGPSDTAGQAVNRSANL